MKLEGDLLVYDQQVVFIFDECYCSQFGEVQKNLNKKFKWFYQFGFIGMLIFFENVLGVEMIVGVFGCELYFYVIIDVICDEKVLKFKVDYNNVCFCFKVIEIE